MCAVFERGKQASGAGCEAKCGEKAIYAKRGEGWRQKGCTKQLQRESEGRKQQGRGRKDLSSHGVSGLWVTAASRHMVQVEVAQRHLEMQSHAADALCEQVAAILLHTQTRHI